MARKKVGNPVFKVFAHGRTGTRNKGKKYSAKVLAKNSDHAKRRFNKRHKKGWVIDKTRMMG